MLISNCVFVVLILIALVAAVFGGAWLALPAGAVAAAGPLVLLSLASYGLILPMFLVCRMYERLLDRAAFSGLVQSTGEWTRARVDLLGLEDVTVAAFEGGSGYHPSSRTLILEERVFGEHSVRARAVAAHELGHAELHTRVPVLGRLMIGCRALGARLFGLGLALLIGSTFVAVPALVQVSWWSFAVGLGCALVVVLDEIYASVRGAWLLSGDPELDRRHVVASAGLLALALATYLAAAFAVALPLLAWPSIVAHIGTGFLVVAAGPLSTGLEIIILLVALIMVAGALSAALRIVVGDRLTEGWTSLSESLVAVGLLLAPIFVFLVSSQASVMAHPWVVVLAVASIWWVPAIPVLIPVELVARYLGGKIDLVAKPSQFSSASELASLRRASKERVEARELIDAQGPDGVLARLWSWRSALLLVPIMLAYFQLL